MWRLWFDGQTFNIFCCLFFFFRYRSLTCLPSHVTPWSLFSVACFRLTAFAMQGEARQTRWDSKSWGSWLVWAHQTNMSLWPELLDKKLVWPQLTWSFIAAALLEGGGQGQSGLNIYMPEYLLPAGHALVVPLDSIPLLNYLVGGEQGEQTIIYPMARTKDSILDRRHHVSKMSSDTFQR